MNSTCNNNQTDLNHQLRIRRRDAMRHLLSFLQMKESLALSKQPTLRNSVASGIQTALTFLIALPAVYLSPWSNMIGFAGLGAMVALFGRFTTGWKLHSVLFQCSLCQTLVVFVMSVPAWLNAPEYVQLSLLTIICGVLIFVCNVRQLGIPGPLIFLFAAGASVTPHLSGVELLQRTIVIACVSTLAWLVCYLTQPLNAKSSEQRPFPVEVKRPISHILIASSRTAVGCGAAIFIARYALDATHPGWAALGAMAVLQGVYLHINMNRALQRIAGALFGAVITLELFQLNASIWMVIVMVAIMQILAEVFIGMNYALGQTFVTPTALLMTSLASVNSSQVDFISERVFDTVLGACVGIVVAVILSSLDDRIYLDRLRKK